MIYLDVARFIFFNFFFIFFFSFLREMHTYRHGYTYDELIANALAAPI